MNNGRARYVWDYDLTQEQFDAMLEGRYENGPLNRDIKPLPSLQIWQPIFI